MPANRAFYLIMDSDGSYLPERHASMEAARHARIERFGCRALAHPIVRVPDLRPDLVACDHLWSSIAWGLPDGLRTCERCGKSERWRG